MEFEQFKQQYLNLGFSQDYATEQWQVYQEHCQPLEDYPEFFDYREQLLESGQCEDEESVAWEFQDYWSNMGEIYLEQALNQCPFPSGWQKE